MHRVSTLRLDSNDLALWPELFDGICDSSDEATSSHRDDQRIKVITLLANFEPDRSGTQGDWQPFERVNEEPAFLSLDGFRYFESPMNIVYKNNLSAIRSTSFDTRRVRSADHDHFCVSANRLRRERRCDCVISRAHRCHTGLLLHSAKTV
jgi:hypothetical protein